MIDSILSQNTFQKIYKKIPKNSFENSAHDFEHSLRVAKNAIEISKYEGGDTQVLVIAALLHDIKNLDKNDPESYKSSQLSCQKSKEILTSIKYPEEKLALVLDAILCHSFSAGFTPQTLEGKIFQDADRLDALGAIGIARLFATSATFDSKLYSHKDPFLKHGRQPNDKKFAVDHFFAKIFKIPELMQTKTGKNIAEKRVIFMKEYLKILESEV